MTDGSRDGMLTWLWVEHGVVGNAGERDEEAGCRWELKWRGEYSTAQSSGATSRLYNHACTRKKSRNLEILIPVFASARAEPRAVQPPPQHSIQQCASLPITLATTNTIDSLSMGSASHPTLKPNSPKSSNSSTSSIVYSRDFAYAENGPVVVVPTRIARADILTASAKTFAEYVHHPQ